MKLTKDEYMVLLDAICDKWHAANDILGLDSHLSHICASLLEKVKKHRQESKEPAPGHADAPSAALEVPSFAVSSHEYMSFLDD